MAERSLMVVALGGNAISKPSEEGNVEQQFANSRATARQLADLIEEGHQLVITHGNGPQIGNFLLRNRAAAGAIYPLPMEVAVAHVQGGMGFMIAQTLANELMARGQDRRVSAFVTTVLVDHDDPGFADPTKPIGRAIPKAEADEQAQHDGWIFKRTDEGLFRRVVASPPPRKIMEVDTIRRAVEAGDLVVACGGGGIPVVREPGSGLRGVRAVIDKDLASALLASELDADALVILTAVEQVCVDFGKPTERAVPHMTLAEAEAWMGQGQFPPGSMGPKVQAAINFLRAAECNDARVIIGPLDRAKDALVGATGTAITLG